LIRLGVGDIDLILTVEEDPARRPELRPGRQVLALLIEQLDPVVAAIGDEDSAPAAAPPSSSSITLAAAPRW